MKPFNHPQAQRAFAIEHFKKASVAANASFLSCSSQTLLLHLEPDRLNRIRWPKSAVLVLKGFDPGDKHVAIVGGKRACGGLKTFLQRREYRLQVIVVSDGLNVY